MDMSNEQKIHILRSRTDNVPDEIIRLMNISKINVDHNCDYMKNIYYIIANITPGFENMYTCSVSDKNRSNFIVNSSKSKDTYSKFYDKIQYLIQNDPTYKQKLSYLFKWFQADKRSIDCKSNTIDSYYILSLLGDSRSVSSQRNLEIDLDKINSFVSRMDNIFARNGSDSRFISYALELKKRIQTYLNQLSKLNNEVSTLYNSFNDYNLFTPDDDIFCLLSLGEKLNKNMPDYKDGSRARKNSLRKNVLPPFEMNPSQYPSSQYPSSQYPSSQYPSSQYPSSQMPESFQTKSVFSEEMPSFFKEQAPSFFKEQAPLKRSPFRQASVTRPSVQPQQTWTPSVAPAEDLLSFSPPKSIAAPPKTQDPFADFIFEEKTRFSPKKQDFAGNPFASPFTSPKKQDFAENLFGDEEEEDLIIEE